MTFMSKYILSKTSDKHTTIIVKIDETKGYRFTPKNEIKYDLLISNIIIVNNKLKEFILIKRDKKKLELFFEFVTSDDDESAGVADIVLDDLKRYREIVRYKYRKHLNDKYINILLKKLNLIEKELKTKQLNQINNMKSKEISSKSR